MQQRVTIGPLRDESGIAGVMIAIEDVTARLEEERALAEALASDDADVRSRAEDAIASAQRIDGPGMFEPALRDANWRVRRAAVSGLAQASDYGFILSLVESLRRDHGNFNLLSSALRLLAATDVDVTAPLAALLQEDDPNLRIQAALALGDQHDPAAIAALGRALHDPEVNVRFQAVESLGRLRADSVVDELLAIVESRDFFLAFAALDALAAINEPRVAPDLVPLLDDDLLRVAVADALGELGDDRVVRPLIDVLNGQPRAAVAISGALVRIYDRFERDYHDGSRVSDLVRDGVSPVGRGHVLSAVAQASEEQLPALVRMIGWFDGAEAVRTLTHLLGQPGVRNDVIEALVRQGDSVVDLVLEQLEAEDDETRHAAIEALGRLGSRRATAALTALLDGDDHLLVAVAGALARIGDRAAFEPLLPLLGHLDGAVRQSAIGALNSIGHPELPARIVELLDDADALVRESAVRIAGYFGYPETIDRLIARAADDDEQVRRAALEHLPFVEDPRVLPALMSAIEHGSAGSRAAAARALGGVDEGSAREALARALHDQDGWVRYFAARALAEHRDEAARDELTDLAERDTAPHVRIAAIDALGALPGERALSTLKRLCGDEAPEIAAAALNALGRIAAAEGLPELLQALRSAAPVRRHAAIAGLAAHGSVEAVAALEWTAGADPDPAVAHAAIEALTRISAGSAAGSASAVDALAAMLSDHARRDDASAAIARLPPARIGDVARGLRHPHPEVRRGIVDALGRFQRPEATGLVADALRDSASTVRATAVATLARLGARGMDGAFAQLAAQDPSKAVRRAAATALALARGTAQD
jgi:HEAT repeat protein